MSIYRVTLTASFRGMIVQNVLHFDQHDSGITGATITEIIRDQWMDQFRGFSVDQVIWTNIGATQVTPSVGLTTNLAVSITGNANATSAGDHPCICEKIRVQTATPGKTGRGRIFCPVASLFGHNLGILNPATIAARNVKLATLMSRFPDDDPPFGITFGIAPRDNPSAFKPATTMFCDSKYGIQRRRNIGVGI